MVFTIGISFILTAYFCGYRTFSLEDPESYARAAEFCFGKIIESYKGVTLILHRIHSQNESSIIYDFSKYEESNIIGITALCPDYEEFDEDNDYKSYSIVVDQIIDRYEDGTMVWRYT
jgi:hypothetical protein